jgi:hypothetical protein
MAQYKSWFPVYERNVESPELIPSGRGSKIDNLKDLTQYRTRHARQLLIEDGRSARRKEDYRQIGEKRRALESLIKMLLNVTDLSSVKREEHVVFYGPWAESITQTMFGTDFCPPYQQVFRELQRYAIVLWVPEFASSQICAVCCQLVK